MVVVVVRGFGWGRVGEEMGGDTGFMGISRNLSFWLAWIPPCGLSRTGAGCGACWLGPGVGPHLFGRMGVSSLHSFLPIAEAFFIRTWELPFLTRCRPAGCQTLGPSLRTPPEHRQQLQQD